MLQLGYILLAVTACSLVLKASGYNPRASTPQDLNAGTLGGKSMDPFVKVMVCAPINVKIVPGPEHKLAITADASVEGAFSVNVHQGTLSIEATRDFRTNNAIQVTLVVPNNQLELVNIKSPKSTVAIGSGFSVRRFTGVVANKGELHLFGFNADEALLKTTGDSRVIARGNMRSMQIEATGTSKTYVKGSLRSVFASVSGVSEVHVDPATDDLKISGSVDGLSKILYTRGTCDIGQDGPGLSGVGAMAGGVGAFAGMQFGSVAGMGNVFGGGCKKVDSVRIPSVRPQWTCGLESKGKWTCAGILSGSSSASHSGNGQSFTSTGNGGAVSMSSSSSGGPRFSSPSSSGDGDTDFTYRTNEGSIRSLSCSSNTAELRMFSEPSTAAS